MMLNNEYFSALGLSLKKRKYYLASEVDEILSDIRSQAEALLNENARLKGQLDILNMNKDEIVETLNSAKNKAKEITDGARSEAEEMIANAEAKRDTILKDAELAQNELVQRAEKSISSLREKHTEAIEGLNSDFQAFLLSLYPENKEDGQGSLF